MWVYTGRRLLQLPLTILGVVTVLFFLLRIVPGDPALLILGEEATPEAIEQLQTQLGLDKPLLQQYGAFIGGVVQGDFGHSFRTGRNVLGEILRVLPHTVLLAFGGIVIASGIGIPLGVFAALRRGALGDLLGTGVALLGTSTPVFVVAIVLMLVFGYQLQLLPILGSGDLAQDPAGVGLRLIMPSVAIGVSLAGQIARMTRSSVLEVVNQDFVRTAEAKGVAPRKVVRKHVVRNAMLPVLTVISLSFGVLLSGAVVTETIFARAGVGRLLIDAIYARDYPVVQGVIAFFALAFVMVNVVTDLLYGFLDPRIRFE